MPQIKITQHYSGRLTGEKLIEPGVYEVGDPRLFGLEDYLVNNQKKAVYIGEIHAALQADLEETQRQTEALEAVLLANGVPQETLDAMKDAVDRGFEAALAEHSGSRLTNVAGNATGGLPPGVEAYDDLDIDILRTLVAQRGLTPVATGKNDRVLKADLIAALKLADGIPDGE